jgi:hypothetical protein
VQVDHNQIAKFAAMSFASKQIPNAQDSLGPHVGLHADAGWSAAITFATAGGVVEGMAGGSNGTVPPIGTAEGAIWANGGSTVGGATYEVMYFVGPSRGGYDGQ